MDEGEKKTCENCKREIPAVNFTTHTVFCARNIRVCPVCKEPVPHEELQDHHDKMHKLLPCKQCGESVCGTDLEDHVRDSCAHTMKTCRFCQLELRRGSLPAHERFCGARTERCECGEYIMHKYRQLHLDSNHGFIRLDDDPVPTKNDDKVTNVPKPLNMPNARLADPIIAARILKPINGITSYRPLAESISNIPNLSGPSTSKVDRSRNIVQNSGATATSAATSIVDMYRPRTSGSTNQSNVNDVNVASSSQSGAIPRIKRTNDQPQVNTVVPAPDKVKKNLWSSRSAMKKRPAPKPPAQEPPADPKRDLPLGKALQRQQEEEQKRQEQTAYNLSVGLPPVLSPAAKLEKLRKMDALANRETDDQDYKNRLQGRVWMNTEITPAGYMLGSGNSTDTSRELEATRRRHSKTKSPVNLPVEDRRSDLKDLKPMTPEEFMDRFNELQLRKPEERVNRDRFSQIKSSLRELRRGLNEVTAPYNTNGNNEPNQGDRDSGDNSPVQLPCEFCSTLVPLDDLVQHQTGCRPDLTQYRPLSFVASSPPRSLSPLSPPRSLSPSPRTLSPEPAVYIPCEFCTRPQPVYMLSEHQERCSRDANMLFPD